MFSWKKLGEEVEKDREKWREGKNKLPAVAEPKAAKLPRAPDDVAKLVPVKGSDPELDKERRALELSELRKQRAINERDIAWAECSRFISESRLRTERDPDYSGV